MSLRPTPPEFVFRTCWRCDRDASELMLKMRQVYHIDFYPASAVLRNNHQEDRVVPTRLGPCRQLLCSRSKGAQVTARPARSFQSKAISRTVLRDVLSREALSTMVLDRWRNVSQHERPRPRLMTDNLNLLVRVWHSSRNAIRSLCGSYSIH
jgi:hypothetical protein